MRRTDFHTACLAAADAAAESIRGLEGRPENRPPQGRGAGLRLEGGGTAWAGGGDAAAPAATDAEEVNELEDAEVAEVAKEAVGLPTVSVPLEFTAPASAGTRKVSSTGPSAACASIASPGATVCNMKPGASSAPTEKVRAGWPSTESSTAPSPPLLASTPARRNRLVSEASPASGAGAPSTRASSSALAATTTGCAGTGLAVGARLADRPACVQYAADSAAAAKPATVIQRRVDSVCKCIMSCTSSARERHSCKRDRPRQPGLRGLRRLRGFTLIELMVVLVIIGVLAALIVPNVLDRADDARISAARTDVNNLMQALKLYRLDNQRYPSAEQGLQALVQRPGQPPVPENWKTYLDKLPNDPWGHPYVYLNPGMKGEIDVMSYGADGQPGGEGKNADVGSWQ